jgi:hypothetical protein
MECPDGTRAHYRIRITHNIPSLQMADDTKKLAMKNLEKNLSMLAFLAESDR